MRKRKTVEDYKTLSKNYVWVGDCLPLTVKEKTLWKCSKNHIFTATYDKIKQGKQCTLCTGKFKKSRGEHGNDSKRYKSRNQYSYCYSNGKLKKETANQPPHESYREKDSNQSYSGSNYGKPDF